MVVEQACDTVSTSAGGQGPSGDKLCQRAFVRCTSQLFLLGLWSIWAVALLPVDAGLTDGLGRRAGFSRPLPSATLIRPSRHSHSHSHSHSLLSSSPSCFSLPPLWSLLLACRSSDHRGAGARALGVGFRDKCLQQLEYCRAAASILSAALQLLAAPLARLSSPS